MSVKIRLSRGGTKKRPYFYIVVADSTSPRDGRYIEQIGTHNPLLPKDNADRVKLDVERVKHWLSVGAQPTDRVMRFLDAAGLAKRTPSNNPNKAKPKKKRLEREAAAGRSGRQEGRGRRGQAGGITGRGGRGRIEPAPARPHRGGARHPRRGADPRLHVGAGGHRRLRAARPMPGPSAASRSPSCAPRPRAWWRASPASPTATPPRR